MALALLPLWMRLPEGVSSYAGTIDDMFRLILWITGIVFVIVEVLLVLFVTYPRYDLDTKIDESAFAPKMLQLSQPIVKVLPQIFEKKVDAFK